MHSGLVPRVGAGCLYSPSSREGSFSAAQFPTNGLLGNPACMHSHTYAAAGRIKAYCRVQFMGFIKKQPVAEGGLAIGCVEGTLHKN